MEPVILPHLVHMMERVMRLVVTEKQPAGYLQLLRSFFKVVHSTGSKLKSVHAELLPFLQPCLALILAMLNGPNVSELRNLLLELCLTLPAQLSHLLPLLPRLMKPLVQALQVRMAIWITSLYLHFCVWRSPEFLCLELLLCAFFLVSNFSFLEASQSHRMTVFPCWLL
jgi:hypothetical protein